MGGIPKLNKPFIILTAKAVLPSNASWCCTGSLSKWQDAVLCVSSLFTPSDCEVGTNKFHHL